MHDQTLVGKIDKLGLDVVSGWNEYLDFCLKRMNEIGKVWIG